MARAAPERCGAVGASAESQNAPLGEWFRAWTLAEARAPLVRAGPGVRGARRRLLPAALSSLRRGIGVRAGGAERRERHAVRARRGTYSVTLASFGPSGTNPDAAPEKRPSAGQRTCQASFPILRRSPGSARTSGTLASARVLRTKALCSGGSSSVVVCTAPTALPRATLRAARAHGRHGSA